MTKSEDSHYESSRYVIVWLSMLILGLALLTWGAVLISQNKAIEGAIFHGLGISLVTAGLFKIGVNFLEKNTYKIWRKKYLEIFSIKRKFAKDLYAKEDGRIKHKLQLLSFSAKNAIQQLINENNLYKTLLKPHSEIDLLIVDPSCKDAYKKAEEDIPGNKLKGMQDILDCFCSLKELYKSLDNKLSKDSIFGKLEVKLLGHHPLITIYIRDDHVMIYGPYFPKFRGDEYASIKILRKHNPEIFGQYKKHFDACWAVAQDKTLILFEKGKHPFFNKSLFNEIYKKIERKLNKV